MSRNDSHGRFIVKISLYFLRVMPPKWVIPVFERGTRRGCAEILKVDADVRFQALKGALFVGVSLLLTP